MSETKIQTERTFHQRVGPLWDAVTNHEALRRWFADVPPFDVREGESFVFQTEIAGIHKHFCCNLLTCIDETLIRYAWTDLDQQKEPVVVEWELIPRGGATLLRVTQKGGFATNGAVSEQEKERIMQRWDHLLGNSLQNYLLNV